MRIDFWKKTVPAFTLLNEHKHSTWPGTISTIIVVLAFCIFTAGRIIQIVAWEQTTYADSSVEQGFFDSTHTLKPGMLAFGLQYKSGQTLAAGATVFTDIQKYATVTATIATKTGGLIS
jgi:hypothetical protein